MTFPAQNVHGFFLKPLKIFGDNKMITHSKKDRLSGANPDAGRPFPGPFWDVKALKNPPPTPGLNSSLKNTPQIQKCNLEHEAGF